MSEEITLKGHIAISDNLLVTARLDETPVTAGTRRKSARVVLDEQPEGNFPMSWKDGDDLTITVTRAGR